MRGEVLLLVRKMDFLLMSLFAQLVGRCVTPGDGVCAEGSFEKVLVSGKIHKETIFSFLLV